MPAPGWARCRGLWMPRGSKWGPTSRRYQHPTRRTTTTPPQLPRSFNNSTFHVMFHFWNGKSATILYLYVNSLPGEISPASSQCVPSWVATVQYHEPIENATKTRRNLNQRAQPHDRRVRRQACNKPILVSESWMRQLLTILSKIWHLILETRRFFLKTFRQLLRKTNVVASMKPSSTRLARGKAMTFIGSSLLLFTLQSSDQTIIALRHFHQGNEIRNWKLQCTFSDTCLNERKWLLAPMRARLAAFKRATSSLLN